MSRTPAGEACHRCRDWHGDTRAEAISCEAGGPEFRVNCLEVPALVGRQLETKLGVISKPGSRLELPAFENDEMLVEKEAWAKCG